MTKTELVKNKNIWMCLSSVHIPAENQYNKLDKRSKKTYLVGYTHNGYRVWDAEEQCVLYYTISAFTLTLGMKI